MMGNYSLPAPRNGIASPFLLNEAANDARRQLAVWADQQATLSTDYLVDNDGHRMYRTERLQPWATPLLLAMNLTGHTYTMYRAANLKFIHADINHPVYAIPINIIHSNPHIRDLATNAPVTLLVGWYFKLSGDVLISPEIDYLVLETRLEENR
ncbi:uncharacterized protein N7496_000849 [Penicillium cataractarum]|uniref:Uncharacterized protein n=1 Tax=Penicillium cataractarum TaxID=2100454 RepID=A0A9X0B6E3_9EURO|nr:uncharacterized protein N7496_000849 [Penicillium cataractarum]KAJ5389781.1 hypothetical protein N7496_000849 [Penicillium cataractarum]